MSFAAGSAATAADWEQTNLRALRTGRFGDRGLAVIVASVSFQGPRLSEQHLALALAADHDVIYVDPAEAVWTRESGFAGGFDLASPGAALHRYGAGLLRVTVRVPPGARRRIALPWIDRWRSAVTRRVLAATGGPASAVLSAAGRPRVFTGIPAARRVFWAKDDYVAGAELLGLDPVRIATARTELATVVDAVVAVTPELRDSWRARVADTVLIPAGSDPAMAAAAADAPVAADIVLPRPIAGFVGQISDRVEFALLEAVARTGASLLLVGRRQPSFGGHRALEALLERPNVQWVGPRAYEQLPGYLAAIDVGLVPYSDTAFNRASFPLKLLEYLSVGAAVVATDLPAMRWLDSPNVRLAGAADWAEAVGRELALAAAGGPAWKALQELRRTEASRHTWAMRARLYADALQL